MSDSQVNDILLEISNLAQLIKELKKDVSPMRSAEIKELATALAKAQGEYQIAPLNKINPYFKSSYADWLSVVGASRPALTKYGLSVTQDVCHKEDGTLWCITELKHNSGEWQKSQFRMIPPKTDIQAISSYTTYVKRICYSSLLGVVTGDEFDDDAELAVASTRETMAKGVALNNKYNPRDINPEVITVEQLEELEYELSEHADIAQQILEGMKLQSLADMPKNKWSIALKRVREIKLLRNN